MRGCTRNGNVRTGGNADLDVDDIWERQLHSHGATNCSGVIIGRYCVLRTRARMS
jgi:hypothetical protein